MVKTHAFRLGLVFACLLLATALAPGVGASPSPAPSLDGYFSGCTGEYFNNTTLSGSPALVRTDGAINFNWAEGASPGPGVQTSGYSVRWTCAINISTANTYTFNITTDDGMNLLVDGNLLIWAWFDQGPTSYSNSIYLNTGSHTIRVEYYNNVRGGTAQVSANIPGVGTSYVPPTYVPPAYVPPAYVPPAYTPSYVSPSASGLLTACRGEYYNNLFLFGTPVFIRNDPALNFYWREGTSPGRGIPRENYSVRWTCSVNVTTAGTYAFNVLSDDGMNVWVDGVLVIAAWYDQPPAAYSNGIYLNPGVHSVRVEYYNRTLGGTAQVSTNIPGTGAPYVSPGYVQPYVAPPYVPPSYVPPAYIPPYVPPAYTPPYANGLISNCTGEYFNNTSLSGSPVMVRNDGVINFVWREGTSPGPGVQIDNYSVRWTCSINVGTSGTYTVYMTTDDGMNVIVDSTLVIWAWYDQGPSSYSNSIYLNSGGHTVRVEYYNRTLGGTAQVSLR